jgi:hypothetical protein
MAGRPQMPGHKAPAQGALEADVRHGVHGINAGAACPGDNNENSTDHKEDGGDRHNNAV